MGNNTEDPELYTPEKIKEVIAWFNEHDAQLPESFQMDASIYIPNLKEAIDGMSQMSLANCENPNFYPGIKRFYKLRDILAKVIEEE